MSQRTCHVYAIELPDGTIYVGSTCKTIAQRVAEHRENHGRVRLRRDLCPPGRHALTREGAERIERELAERLRRMGHEVRQG